MSVKDFIKTFNFAYEKVHVEYENHFWSTKMGLKGASTAALASSKNALEEFLGDEAALLKVQQFLKQDLDKEDFKILKCFEKTFKCYIVSDPEAKKLKQRITELEGELQNHRNSMKLQYLSNGKFIEGSSVLLRNVLTTSEVETERKSAWEGLESIGSFVSEKFCEIVQLRNQLARALGYIDFYDMKVTQAEGFGKVELFEILDTLKNQARQLSDMAEVSLAAKKGQDALKPWNRSFAMQGKIKALQDPYFPFQNAVGTWARSFAALGISYKDAVMNLDLCDRKGKYPNGFCHWTQPAWQSPNGWVPSRTNFTSLATPSAVGSGQTALVTLMHEGGHAAHFSNVVQHSPLFAQERAPTSVAYAETQSMFLDSVVGDADWLARYALDVNGNPMPWELIEESIKDGWEKNVAALMNMLVVPYFEKALYELDEANMTPAGILELAKKIELEVIGYLSPRPTLSVPHILSDESACYYHGYVLAEMAVHQTRAFFLKKYGKIVDNPQIGHDLTEFYWKVGNSENFLDLVKGLTGASLTGNAWIEKLKRDPQDVIASEREVQFILFRAMNMQLL
jgi:oligoendopeptidase F